MIRGTSRIEGIGPQVSCGRVLPVGESGTENLTFTRPLRRCDSLESGATTVLPRRTVNRVPRAGPHPSTRGDAVVTDTRAMRRLAKLRERKRLVRSRSDQTTPVRAHPDMGGSLSGLKAEASTDKMLALSGRRARRV